MVKQSLQLVLKSLLLQNAQLKQIQGVVCDLGGRRNRIIAAYKVRIQH